MSTNGSADESSELEDTDFESFLDALGPDFDPSVLLNRYVSFEQIVGTLMWATVESKLQLYSISTILDTNTLERSFHAMCVPQEWAPPFDLHAEVEFFWPTEHTLLSQQGDDALYDLYHLDEEALGLDAGAADYFTELEIEYHLPHTFVEKLDSDEGIERTARQVRMTFADVVEHENIVEVEATAHFDGESVNLTGMTARHYWTLEDELRNLPLLSQVLLAVCDEIRRVLERFQEEFPSEVEEILL